MMAAALANVAAYSVQLGAVVAVAAAATWLWPIRDPRRAHRFWQGLFVVALMLPLAAWWPRDEVVDAPAWLVVRVATTPVAASVMWFDWVRAVAMLLASGALARLSWLVVGLAAVRRIVRRATSLVVPDTRVPGALSKACPRLVVRLSGDIQTPVTVGVLWPVVLLPLSWSDLDDTAARAVLLHEVVHVQRRDWLRVVAEETWCAVLWFHPAARALVSRLDTAREMVVDQRVVATLGDWRGYARTLMAFSEATGGVPHLVATLIRSRHLHERILALSEEANMARRRPEWTIGVVSALVAAVTVGTVSAVPLPGAAGRGVVARSTTQDEVFDIGSGVTSPRVTHDVKADYTKAALEAKIQGQVWLSVVVKKDGTVGDVQVRQSLDREFGLDDAAVAAMRQWTFEPARRAGEAVAVRVTVEMRFTLKD